MAIDTPFSVKHARATFTFKNERNRDHFIEELTKAGLQ